MEPVQIATMAKGLYDLGMKIKNLAGNAKSNQRSCDVLGIMGHGLAMTTKDAIELYTNEAILPSKFKDIAAQIFKELENTEELVKKAGSMGPIQKFFFSDGLQKEFNDAKMNLTMLVTSLNNVTVTHHAKEGLASIRDRLASLSQKSAKMGFTDELSPEQLSRKNSVATELSKTMDRLKNELIDRKQAMKEFMGQLEKLDDANEAEGNLPALFNILEEEIKRDKHNKNEQTQAYNELMLESVIRLTLDPPEGTFCPLTHALMVDPVIIEASADHTPVERSFAEEWFLDRGNKHCPITGQILDDFTLTPDTKTKRRIEIWKRSNGLVDSVPDMGQSAEPSSSSSQVLLLDQELEEDLAAPSTPQFLGANGRHRLDGTLGGSRWKCYDTQADEAVTIKILQRGRDVSELNHNFVAFEIMRHSRLFHPYIVNFKEAFLSEKYLCVAMDFAEGGSLADYVNEEKCLGEALARGFFQQLIVADEHCYNEGVLQTSGIKLENIFLNKEKNQIKLGRLQYIETPIKPARGFLPSVDPGFDFFIDQGGLWNEKMDVWYCGVALFHMLFGFDAHPELKPTDRVLTRAGLEVSPDEDIKIPAHHHPGGALTELSSDCQDLLGKMLVGHPERRIDLPNIKQHPWFNDHLPEGLLGFNAWEEKAGTRELQSEEDIENLVKEAGTILQE